MKLNKTKWERVKIGQVTSIVGGGTPSRKNPDFFKGDVLWIGPTEIPKDRIRVIQDTNEKITIEAIKKSNAKLVPPGTILFTTRATVGEVAIAGKEIATSQSLENFICNPNKVNNWYLAYWLKGNQSLILSLSAGTTFKGITRNILSKIEIPLPPLKEQIEIASIFQSIETVYEQFENQGRTIESIRKTLIDGLLDRVPHLGNLLQGNNLINTKIGEIADCIEKHDKEKNDIVRFVGLENIESGDFKIGTWGNISNGTTFTKRFNYGDVLFGKRRPYLKKIAVADFDGICSGDILVIRVRKGSILPGLLPYYIASDAFIQHAVTTSAGSLSPRTKWKDLKEFKVSIPDLQTQSKVLEVFYQIQTVLNQIKDQKSTLRSLKHNLLNEILG